MRKIKTFAEVNEAFTNVIGEKTAKNIVKTVIEMAKESDLDLPNLQKFLDKGAVPGVLLEAYEEFEENVNNGSNKKSVRLAYEYTTKFRDFVFSYLPDEAQLKMLEHYGAAKIKKMIS